MTIKIICKKRYEDNVVPFVGGMDNLKVIDMETGVDISESVRNITINIAMDDFATAILEVDVGEVELEGIEVLNNMEDLNPDFSKTVDKHFWGLLKND